MAASSGTGRLIAGMLVLASATTCALAQQTQPAGAPLVAGYGPLHRIRFPGNPTIHSAAFSPDGQTLFVHVRGTAINVWELLVYYWPEILGTLTALTTLVCLIGLRRIVRHKRIVGEPHCRRCNYCLKGCTSDRCPECGTPIRRPVIGRPMRRRVLPFAVPLAVALVGYGSLWAVQAPRTGFVSAWVNRWSFDLEDWAGSKGISLAGWSRRVDRVLEVDVESGRTRRTLIARPDRLRSRMPLVVSPDGTGLIMTLDDGDRLALVSTRSGRIRHGDAGSRALP